MEKTILNFHFDYLTHSPMMTPGKGHYCIDRELFCKHGSWSLIKYVLRKGLLAYMQQEFSLWRFFYQVKEVVLLIVGARMDRDPSPS